MKSAGQILQTARLAKKLEPDDVARITRIRPQFILAIESDAYSHLPSGTVARGFIRNYAEFLGLNAEHILAVFRRDFVENRSGQIVPRGMVDPVNKISFWTPRSTVIASVALLCTVFLAYLVYQYRILTGPPPLELTQPRSGLITTENNVEVAGTTDPDATISVNHQLVALEKGGHFFVRLPLTLGQNSITVVATAKSGQSTQVIRQVTLTSAP